MEELQAKIYHLKDKNSHQKPLITSDEEEKDQKIGRPDDIYTGLETIYENRNYTYAPQNYLLRVVYERERIAKLDGLHQDRDQIIPMEID